MAGTSDLTLAAAFTFFALWETYAPWRMAQFSVARRWLVNISLGILGALCWRWVAGIGAVTVAALASPGAGSSEPWRFAVTILLLDFVRYGFHRAAHAVPWFWRVHVLHHSDPEVDCTSGLRFHPLEAVAEHAWVIAWIYGLGLPPLGVAASELLTITVGVAEHANIRLPRRVERVLRLVFVTPETHRVHHSADPRDHGRNFGAVFLVWDRLFRTYAAATERPLRFGVPQHPRKFSCSTCESHGRLGNHPCDSC